MKKTKLGIIIALIMMVAIIATSIASYANNQESIFVNLTPANSKGVGYGIGDPTGEASGEAPYIWNINTYTSSAGTTLTEFQRNLYCIKANYGNSWETAQNASPSNVVEYNLSYDLVADKDSILQKLKIDEAGNLVRELLDATNGKYNELLWLLDNLYISGQTDKDEFLDKIGIAKDEDGYYNKESKKTYTYVLTDDDIKAVQKVAIWYFTNGTDFDVTTLTDWLNITLDNGTSYNPLVTSTYPRTEGEERNEQANILYNYLVAEAAKNSDYVSPDVAVAPINIKETENNKINTVRKNQNYLIGPIEIQRNNDLGYDIKIEVSNEDGTLLDKSSYTYTDKEGTLLQYTTDKELAQNNDEFYVCIDRSLVESVSIKVTIEYNTTPKKLWLKGTDDENGIVLAGEQPLVEVTQDPKELIVELTSRPEEFDLALRKYITAVNGTNVTNTREPDINEETLLTGTTATYNHRKDPVVVQDKDEVTYQITIYNEGNKAGYATKIIDQLPDGLINSKNNSSLVVSKGPNGEIKNQYRLDYYSSTNKIELTLIQWPEELEQGAVAEGESYVNALQPYTAGNLDYETIEIKCKVAQAPNDKQQIILTNVAWIAAAYNFDDQEEIINQGQDRDSEPYTSPNEKAEDLKTIGNIGYIGNQENNSNKNLAESIYFEGQQDDDDFEKLVIMPVKKIFDLELVKFIAAISKDAKIDDGEYLTDTKNANGIYERAPKISIVKEQDSEDRRIHCDWSPSDKNPVLVEAGDYVLYTIRVYNAGEVDGYASLIKDHLPVGLEFVETTDENAEYYGIWNVDRVADENGDEKQILSTNYLAKGQGKELDATEGEERYTANLLRALNKDGEVTDGENRNPDYRDVQVLCRVKEQAQKDGVLINYAQISNDTDKDGNDINDEDSTPDNLPEEGPHEDDEDYEKVKLQCFDLSLRKFITQVNGKALEGSREPVVDVSNLVNKTDTTAVYKHSKQPVAVKVGDKLVYTIRVYNEGDINGFASEVTDYLPPYLTFVKDSEINTQYGWTISEDGRIVTTTYLANTEIKAFNGTKLDYADLKIECIVAEEVPLNENQTNIAEISEYTYNDSTVDKDIDSTSDNMEDKIPEDENLPEYKDDEIDKEYVPGNEDDDDFEKIYVKEFDLALRKFITQVQGNEVTTRVPQVKIENGTITYEHSKDALIVHVGDVVIYTLRIYNEGQLSGYASEITDDIPEYLEYLPEESTNVQYMWKMYDENGNETENVEEAVKVKTKYLSKENGEDNLIKAFDGTTLDYKDIKIAFKVKDPNSNTHIITNHAQISDDTDENGEEVDDKDSKTDEWNEGEDDQDIENVKVQYFDLSLLKFVSKVIVIENGKETITETGYNGHEDPEPVVKVELHKKKLNEVIVKFGYGITITNEGDIAGYATEITDYVPEGLKFDPTDNPEWTDEGNNVIATRQLENTLLQPGESATIEVIFTWINSPDNLAQKTNTAEISEDKNEYDVPDRDSTPDNKEEGEDDIDIAKVILAITTGAAKTYFMLTLGLLTIVLVGVVLIKKFVI